MGTDPVAVDAVGARLLQIKRTAYFGEDRALDVPPIHITVADKKYHLGVSDLNRIDLIKLEWEKNGQGIHSQRTGSYHREVFPANLISTDHL